MTNDENVLKALLQERGYVVVVSEKGKKMKIGELAIPEQCGVASKQPFYVLAGTNRRDYLAQRPILRRFHQHFNGEVAMRGWVRFYRVGTD